ncbi:hypothetical protein LCL61_00950 [Amycolatopsis coloradensis]|uniref:Uncharacterized protein n=1 Tax=Amycolatopsis coloradensis TaxID=76021 RepID=A0ACD5B443_9PSEU
MSSSARPEEPTGRHGAWRTRATGPITRDWVDFGSSNVPKSTQCPANGLGAVAVLAVLHADVEGTGVELVSRHQGQVLTHVWGYDSAPGRTSP